MKNTLQIKARALRVEGLSYKEIREEINVAKSTLSLWLRNVPLKPEYKKRLYTKQIEFLSHGPHSQKERRSHEIDAIIEKAASEISFPLSKEAQILFGVALYWAEGDKGKNFEITNSDPYLILYMTHWLKSVFDIDPDALKAYLNIYSQQDEVAIKGFWSELTGIPVKNFGKSYIKPSNKHFKKNNLYYGTIQIYIPKGTNLKHRVFGWTKAVLQNYENEIYSIEKNWESLRNVPRPANVSEEIDLPL